MPAHPHHLSLFVRDLERSLELFAGILGMEEFQRLPGVGGGIMERLLGIPGFTGDLVMLRHPGQPVFLELVRQTAGGGSPAPCGTAMAGVGLSLMVDDLPAVHAALDQAGWPPLSEPLAMRDPQGEPVRLCCFRTEEGLLVELIEKTG